MQTCNERAKIIRDLATDNQLGAQAKNVKQHDKKAAESKLQVGDQVLIKNNIKRVGKCPKLDPKFTGPYYISKKTDKNTFQVMDSQTNKPAKPYVNAERLKPYHDPSKRPTNIGTKAPIYIGVEKVSKQVQNDSEPVSNKNVTKENTQSLQKADSTPQAVTTSQTDQPVSHNDDHDTRDSDTTVHDHTMSQTSVNNSNDKQTDTIQTDDSSDQAKKAPVHKNTPNTQYHVTKIHQCNTNDSRGVMYFVSLAGQRERVWIFKKDIDPELVRKFHIEKTNKGTKRKRKLVSKQV